MSPTLGNLVNTPAEGGRAACPSACSMATIVHCTFSRAHKSRSHLRALDSFGGGERGALGLRGVLVGWANKPRSEGEREGRRVERGRASGGGRRKKIMHKILFAERTEIGMNRGRRWGEGGGLMGLES